MCNVVILNDNCGEPTKFKEFTSYKVIRVDDTYYVWESSYFGPSHCQIAEEYSNNDLSRILCAGGFRFRSDLDKMIIGSSERNSLSLRRTKACSYFDTGNIKKLAELFGLEPYDDFLDEKIE